MYERSKILDDQNETLELSALKWKSNANYNGLVELLKKLSKKCLYLPETFKNV